MIVCLYLGITFDHHRLAITDQSAARHVPRQAEILHLPLGNLGIRTCDQLRHIRIRESQTFHVRDIRVQKE